MSDLLRRLGIVTIVMLVPMIPFLFFGDVLEARVEELRSHPLSTELTAAAVAGVLATDILLPIPASMVSTFAGSQLGVWLGTAASWLGMTAGAVIGFALARAWGSPLAERFSGPGELARMQRLSTRFGPLVLVLCRALPLLAEASVLLLGVHRLPWRKFLPAVMLSNLGVSAAYAGLGDLAAQKQWLPFALGLSGALPLLIALVVRGYLPGEEREAQRTEE